MKIDIIFPCGFEYHLRTGFLDYFGSTGNIEFKECPIHGKNCKRIELRQIQEIK